ncbi:MAG TPA: hypothetical protein VMU45_08560 [Candidatus Eisenbacteria bacterium]|nr:hypothetical protein [Candidatus Eisenbacteria bacterium]
MYTNGNFESHMAALCFLGTAGLTILLAVATVVLFFSRRAWARYSLLAIALLLGGYAAVLGFFSWASYDRTVARGDEKFYCGMDCHIAYSVQNVERAVTIGDTTARGEFVVITLRSHFDERTIAPWRGNGALRPDPPTLELVDGKGRSYPVSPTGQKAWENANSHSHTLTDPLRPGESYETTWVFEVPADVPSLRLFAGWHGFPSYLLIGDEDSPRHGKTYFAL